LKISAFGAIRAGLLKQKRIVASTGTKKASPNIRPGNMSACARLGYREPTRRPPHDIIQRSGPHVYPQIDKMPPPDVVAEKNRNRHS